VVDVVVADGDGAAIVGSVGTGVAEVVDVVVADGDGAAIAGAVGAGMVVDVEFVEFVEVSGEVPPTTAFDVVTVLGVDRSAPSELDVCRAADGTVVVAHGGPVATTGPAMASAVPVATTATSTVGRRLRRPIQSATAPASTTAAAMTRTESAAAPVAGNRHSLTSSPPVLGRDKIRLDRRSAVGDWPGALVAGGRDDGGVFER
jgi:hypothetical protein